MTVRIKHTKSLSGEGLGLLKAAVPTWIRKVLQR
jgi:hypothetical protein